MASHNSPSGMPRSDAKAEFDKKAAQCPFLAMQNAMKSGKIDLSGRLEDLEMGNCSFPAGHPGVPPRVTTKEQKEEAMEESESYFDDNRDSECMKAADMSFKEYLMHRASFSENHESFDGLEQEEDDEEEEESEAESANQQGSTGVSAFFTQDTGNLPSFTIEKENASFDPNQHAANQEMVVAMKESLARAIKMGTKQDNIGTMMYEHAVRILPDPVQITKRGKAVMGRAFRDIMATASAFANEPVQLKEMFIWVGLRHVHYGLELEWFPFFKQALVSAFEQLLGDMWTERYESSWAWAYEVAQEELTNSYNLMRQRHQLINEDWQIATEQLGMEALSAKVSANLLVTALNAHDKQGKKGSTNSSKNTILAYDVVALLKYLIDSINNLKKLRGVVDRIGIPFDELFKNFKMVPNLEKILPVVTQTMQEVVGANWSDEHQEAWTWLWMNAVNEKKQSSWKSGERELLVQSWGIVEKNLTRTVNDGIMDGKGRDFFVDETSNDGDGKGVGFNHMLPGRRDSARQGSDKGGMGSDKSSRRTKQTNGEEVGCCGRRQVQEGDGASTIGTSNNTAVKKRQQQEKVKERLSSGYKVSWDLCEVFAKHLFAILAKESPSVDSIFVKNREAYTVTVQGILQRLLAYSADPHLLWKEDEELSLRHINYGVMPGDIPIFREVFLMLFVQLGEGEWTRSYTNAWRKFMGISLQGLADVLVAAMDPVTKALVNHNPVDLLQGLTESPRGTRARIACEVEIMGVKKSPIYWMLEAGYAKLSQICLIDCLAIRANKSYVYYGRDTLWNTHGVELIQRICTEAPEMATDLLDGHMWCSDDVVRGMRRVIFYARELWGDPTLKDKHGEVLYPTSATTPLALLTKLQDAEVTSHPMMGFLVNKKWELFGKKFFILLESLILLQTAFFVCGYVWVPGAYTFESRHELAFAFRVLSWFLALINLGLFVYRCMYQMKINFTRNVLAGIKVSFQVPVSASSAWNVLRVISNTLLIAVALLELITYNGRSSTDTTVVQGDNKDSLMLVTAIQCLIAFVSILQSFFVSLKLTELVVGVQSIMIVFAKYMVFFLALLVGFSTCVALFSPETSEEFASFESSLVLLIAFVTNAWAPNFDGDLQSPSIRIVLIIFMLTMGLLMVNALTSVIILAWSQEQDMMLKAAQLVRADIVAEIESICSNEFLAKVAATLNFNKKLHLDDERELGPDGGIEAYVVASEFKVPGIGERGGRANRIERYESEESEQAPWPQDALSGIGSADGGSIYMEKCMESLLSLNREVQNMRAPANRLFRFVKSAIKKMDRSEGDELSEEGTHSETAL